jgi:hypothetical protein
MVDGLSPVTVLLKQTLCRKLSAHSAPIANRSAAAFALLNLFNPYEGAEPRESHGSDASCVTWVVAVPDMFRAITRKSQTTPGMDGTIVELV